MTSRQHLVGQAQLFAPSESSAPYRMGLVDGTVDVYPGFFASWDLHAVTDALLAELAWRQEVIVLYGRETPVPRLTAWHGDPGSTYVYSGIRHEAVPWTPTLERVRRDVEAATRCRFNSVLANQYRSGADGVAWHADDEPELGSDPVIASASFGATRRFQLRHRHDGDDRHDLDLASGSLVVMSGATQRHWHHRVPKTSRPVGVRVNLTFRMVRR